MIANVLVVVASVVGAASIALAWSHLRSVETVVGADAVALAIALKRVKQAERERELFKRTPKSTWVHDLAAGLLEAEDEAARVAVANDALSEAEHMFEQRRGWPSAGARIAAFGGLFLAVIAFLALRETTPALTIAVVGAGAALACIEAGRRAKRRSEIERKNIDDLVKVVLGPVDEAAAPPARTWRRRGK